jgi:Protein of unknown function (DUF1800)
MMFGPDPLGERLTLMWHNHFATSNAKVNNLVLVRRQNEAFRVRARGRFTDLLNAAVRDPALLIWLDAPSNRREHPNENLARELMELFTLGIGHYSESDVKQAARAWTGWTVKEDRFDEDPEAHHSGEKAILGRRGNWRGADLVRILAENPATSGRLAWRISDTFLGKEAVSPSEIQSLAEDLRRHDLDVAWGVETVLRSEAFFAESNLGRCVFASLPEDWLEIPSTPVLGCAYERLPLFKARCGVRQVQLTDSAGAVTRIAASVGTDGEEPHRDHAARMVEAVGDGTAVPAVCARVVEASACLRLHPRTLGHFDPPALPRRRAFRSQAGAS